MNVRPRLLISSLVTAKTGMSNKTKPPTHYETLEVNPRATQSEIKSAYFKLSKKYHPDKNSSEAATAKFRDITDAYEVLASYKSRKTYDRSILTRTRYNGPQDAGKQADPRIKYYQSQAAVFRQDARSGSTPGFDFDAWTKAHYGRTFEKSLRSRMAGATRRANREEPVQHSMGRNDVGIFVFAVVFMAVMMILSIPNLTDGEDAPTINQRKELAEKNLSEIKFSRTSVD